jgi:hypothetical protein
MDTEQLTEEQLYYKEKYFKYKLKYVTLKKQHGGMFKKIKELFRKESDEKLAFDPNKIKTYLDSKFKDDTRFKNDALYEKIKNKDIIKVIKETPGFTVENAIDAVLKIHFPNDNDIQALKQYLINLIDNYNKEQINMDRFDPFIIQNVINDKEFKMRSKKHPDRSEYTRLSMMILQKNILKFIKNRLSTNNFVSLEDAIDNVLNEYPNDKKAFKSFIMNEL